MSNIYDALNRSKHEKRDVLVPTAFVPGGGMTVRPMPEMLDPRRDREFEALRQRIMLEMGRDHTPTLLFTGAVPGEGSTTVALHFAREMASVGSTPVLLIDADLVRTPNSLSGALHEKSGNGSVGLADLLADEREPGTAILATDQPNLHFLPSGGHRNGHTEQLRVDRLQQLLRDLGRFYSCVVIDAGASLQAPDAAQLGRLVDGVVLVVRAHRTRREVVQKALQVLSKAHCKVLGVVLNDRRYPIPEFLYRRI